MNFDKLDSFSKKDSVGSYIYNHYSIDEVKSLWQDLNNYSEGGDVSDLMKTVKSDVDNNIKSGDIDFKTVSGRNVVNYTFMLHEISVHLAKLYLEMK